jgi:hypothetical protein
MGGRLSAESKMTETRMTRRSGVFPRLTRDCGIRMVSSFVLDLRNPLHHHLTQALIQLPALAGEVCLGEAHRFSDDNGDGTEKTRLSASRKSGVRSENPHGHYGRQRLRDDQAEAGQGRLQIAIKRAGAFGEDHRSVSGANELDDGFQCAHVGPVLIHGNDIQFRKYRTENRPIEQCLPREKMEFAPASDASQGRIEIALVIHRENDSAFFDDPLGMHRAKIKKSAREDSREVIEKLVVSAHSNESGGIRAALGRPMQASGSEWPKNLNLFRSRADLGHRSRGKPSNPTFLRLNKAARHVSDELYTY